MKIEVGKVRWKLVAAVPLCALGLTAIYSALDWLLVERTQWLTLDRDVVHLWLPPLFALALVFFFVSPQIALFKEGQRGRAKSLYWTIALAVISVPTVIAQFYLHTGTGTLVHVPSAANAATYPDQTYFDADTICLDRSRLVFEPVITASGRHNEYLEINVYTAVPLCEGGIVYIGLDYSHRIDNRLPNDEKEAQYRAFLKQCDAKLIEENPAHYAYLERLGPSTALRAYEKAFTREKIVGSPIVLAPRSERFDQRAGTLPEWFAATLVGGILLWVVMAMLAPIDRRKVAHTTAFLQKRSEEQLFWSKLLFLPNRDNWGLPLLLDVNVLVYLAMVISGLGVVTFQTEDLIAWGGNFGPDDHGFGFLRLFSSQFVHGGLMHIANNMYGLLFAGFFLLPVARNVRLILAYMLCGLGGSVASVYAHPDTVSVGASGAIFGLFGVLLTLVGLGDKRLIEVRGMIFLNAAIFVGLNLLLGTATPGVDNAAHMGGLVTGLAMGLALFLIDRKQAPA